MYGIIQFPHFCYLDKKLDGKIVRKNFKKESVLLISLNTF